MKRRLSYSSGFTVTLILTSFATVIIAKPLDYETVTSLLPVEPHDVNETIAAVVIDPVVKDAVKHVASNSSLNGLVVKRKVLVMPVNNPETVISKRNQVLVVPPTHLEDVRKNITASAEDETEIDAFAAAEKNPLFGGYGYMNTSNENPIEDESNFTDDIQLDTEDSLIDFTARTMDPEEIEKKVSVPIIAMIDPPRTNNGKVESPIVAILPNQVEGDILKTEVNFLNKNQGQIQNEAQAYIDRDTLKFDPENWRLTSTLPEITRPSWPIEEITTSSGTKTTNLFLETLVAPSNRIKQTMSSREVDDLDVAEDIIFRPLFRYRQEAAQRAKYREEENNYRRRIYQRRKPYNDYDYYSKRNRYRPRYNDDYYD